MGVHGPWPDGQVACVAPSSVVGRPRTPRAIEERRTREVSLASALRGPATEESIAEGLAVAFVGCL
jgi:hypothetical protein